MCIFVIFFHLEGYISGILYETQISKIIFLSSKKINAKVDYAMTFYTCYIIVIGTKYLQQISSVVYFFS